MSYVEIEVRARTVDLAVEAAMQELGVKQREDLIIEVVSEPQRGFLGIGGQDAVVRVKKGRRRRRRNERRNQSRDRSGGGSNRQDRARQTNNGRDKGKSQDRDKGKSQDRDKGKGRDKGREVSRQENRAPKQDDRPVVGLEEQAGIARDFLVGLVSAYGLEGTVETSIEDDVIIANVEGEQTEALVGVRGTVRSAIHELTRTVLQRYSQDSARLRLDIAGYAERRRQALTIYADQLIEQLIQEGGEVMLEPMSSADRKVIHDAAAAHDGVRSYSEGEPPRRYVVLAAVGEAEDAAVSEEE